MSGAEYFAPSLFLNHGGGPNPLIGEKMNLVIAESLKNIPNLVDLNLLKSIIFVSAHREEEVVTISSGERHELLYDYSNFPPETYKLKYNAPGNPSLARDLHDAFKTAGIESKLDDQRGWDHGVFVPMLLINPKADIPVIQLSILKNQNASQHYEIGKVLYEFRKRGVAIFGSGMSFHNARVFREAYTNEDIIINNDFDDFLNRVCMGDVDTRKEIIEWEKAKGGLYSHPIGEADHLMPLIVNVGAAGRSSPRKIFECMYRGIFKLSGFMWDGE